MNQKKAKSPTIKNNEREEQGMGPARNECPMNEKNCDDCKIQICPEEQT